MTEPSKIFFDDEIVMIVKRMIRQKKSVSPTQWALLRTFPAVLQKNKDCLGNLLDTVNLYIVHGKDILTNTGNVEGQAYLKIILSLAEQALFSTKGNVSLTNAEGAILF